MTADLPTYTETWPLLTSADRRRLDELDAAQREILERLLAVPADEVDAPLFAELQVERLRVYRTVVSHAGGRSSPPPAG
ncbi:hypothetical protein ABRQ22_11725 [Cellulosimicrobium sp. ES-005]|jgi:hypothetical protein|uniref:Uncharacterized protein n=1 Tax=Cellulosimicrobium sp. ES-005 TaxID=3163031 RepID=A0AAU8FW21_9MICO